jgi:AmmeMemoRadiSam system protein A
MVNFFHRRPKSTERETAGPVPVESPRLQDMTHPVAMAAGVFSPSDRLYLLALSRRVLRALPGEIAAPGSSEVPSTLILEAACFVTLCKGQALRGCIGQMDARQPLYLAVLANTRGACLKDPRFAPVTADQVPELRIEISILNRPHPVQVASADELLGLLRPGTDGVLLQEGGRLATFLPKVWEQIPDKVKFLERLAQKAGLPADAWRWPTTRVSLYQAESFGED